MRECQRTGPVERAHLLVGCLRSSLARVWLVRDADRRRSARHRPPRGRVLSVRRVHLRRRLEEWINRAGHLFLARRRGPIVGGIPCRRTDEGHGLVADPDRPARDVRRAHDDDDADGPSAAQRRGAPTNDRRARRVSSVWESHGRPKARARRPRVHGVLAVPEVPGHTSVSDGGPELTAWLNVARA